MERTPMTGFTEKNGILHCDGVPLPEIAAMAGTPVYVYSASVIREQYAKLKDTFAAILPADRQPLICYACKANTNGAILRLLKNLGCGLEIVSEGELFRGLRAGFKGRHIISTSFGKTGSEIEACLKADILQFNIESAHELEHVNDIAGKTGKKPDVLFRLNPNVSGGGHHKISTGRKRDKFGTGADRIPALYARAEKLEHVNPVGLSVHIGSQVSTVESFLPAFEKLAETVGILRKNGHSVTRLDIGGGFPILYRDEKLLDLEAYAEWVRDFILPLDTEIQMEPGRYLVGNAGILLSEVLYVKETVERNFLVLDAAMNDLIRPTLYEAWHGISPVKTGGGEKKTYDVVGPVCESGDIFAEGRELPGLKTGGLVAIRSAGAYGLAMASTYNSRPLPAEIMVDQGRAAIIRRRQTLQDIIKDEMMPEWLKD